MIRQLGLLNEHIEQQQAFYGRPVDERHVGLPYPGTLVLDEAGVVTRKVFEQSYRPRPSAGHLFRQATSAPLRAAQQVSARQDAVCVTAWLDAERFHPLEIHDCHLEIVVADGWHVYTDPVPEGFTALSVELTARSEIDVGQPELPRGHPFRVDGLPESFSVLDGTIQLSVPFQLPGAGFELDGRPRTDGGTAAPVRLEIAVSYQACSRSECLPPTVLRLPLRIEEEAPLRP